MIQLDCPRCGQPNQVERLERRADEFCTNCDFPLFWAELESDTAEAAFHSGAGLDQSFRRLPGTAGRVDVEGEPCRRCSERNRPEAIFCNRCGIELHPAPEPPPLPETTPAVVPVVEYLPPPQADDRFYLFAGVLVAFLAVFLLVGIAAGVRWLPLTLAFLGAALGGLAVLGWYWRRARPGGAT